MNNQEFKDLVKGKIFTVTFLKADDTLRTYNARVDVKKYTKGGTNPVEHKSNMVTVFEMGSQQYRTLNLDKVIELKFGGEAYEI